MVWRRIQKLLKARWGPSHINFIKLRSLAIGEESHMSPRFFFAGKGMGMSEGLMRTVVSCLNLQLFKDKEWPWIVFC